MALVRAFAERFAAARAIAGDDLARILVVVEELVTNIVKYGYPPPAQPGTAEIALRLRDGEIGLEIVDDGQAFDPFSGPEPDLDAPLEERTAGGLGLHIVKSLMDRTRYRRVAGHNVVEVWRRVASAK
ncbi:MAG TPA: ATP-binding protein [Stellaceae bacterium]|nr:ATP-binding protein [Stellaceae bacterium]